MKVEEKQFLTLDQVVFFMDNTFIHKIKDFIPKLFINEHGVICNSEYSPQMNPIELSFCKINFFLEVWKWKIRK